MRKRYFVTGTDTEVGKTWVSRVILSAMAKKGLRTIALKPVAAGAQSYKTGMHNEDAVYLMEEATVQLPYSQVNPFLFEEPTAPHIAAEKERRALSVSRIVGLCRGASMQSHDVLLIEGAGGWRVPLNSQETLADVAREMDASIILVVGLKLGCINHALLTAEAIRNDGLPLAGWVANQVTLQPMANMAENISALQSRLMAPCLGVVQYNESNCVEESVKDINVDVL